MDVDADADDHMANARDFRVELGEDAAEFPRAEEEIVGPAQVGLQRSDFADRVLRGESGSEREPENVGRGDGGAEEDADVESRRGRRGPCVGAAAAPLCLLVGEEDACLLYTSYVEFQG